MPPIDPADAAIASSSWRSMMLITEKILMSGNARHAPGGGPRKFRRPADPRNDRASNHDLNSGDTKPVSDWQPIETAPKDGTWIMVWEQGINDKYFPAEIARWCGNRWENSAHQYCNAVFWKPAPEGPDALILE